ncbi:MAG: phosphoribosyltransferase [Pseudomonadota bacterium]|nr:phosphoribosyltransferase [Pseudomonadota bacterium]
MYFSDREDAARRLSDALLQYRGLNPLVLAIPRGAVPMAKIIADVLGGEVDVVLVRKLSAPGNPEFAIGAVDESGWIYLGDYANETGQTSKYIENEKDIQLGLIRERRAMYTPARAPLNPAGRIVIVVDDGLATGSTMIAALHAIRVQSPKKLVCAVPVAPADTLDKVKPYADEIVCLSTPAMFYAVGQFYQSFPQITDAEVVKILNRKIPASGRTKGNV